MNWFDWVIVALFAWSAVVTVATIGKPRRPLDNGTAVATVLICAAVIVGLVLTR